MRFHNVRTGEPPLTTELQPGANNAACSAPGTSTARAPQTAIDESTPRNPNFAQPFRRCCFQWATRGEGSALPCRLRTRRRRFSPVGAAAACGVERMRFLRQESGFGALGPRFLLTATLELSCGIALASVAIPVAVSMLDSKRSEAPTAPALLRSEGGTSTCDPAYRVNITTWYPV